MKEVVAEFGYGVFLVLVRSSLVGVHEEMVLLSNKLHTSYSERNSPDSHRNPNRAYRKLGGGADGHDILLLSDACASTSGSWNPFSVKDLGRFALISYSVCTESPFSS
jgi:hypothetical protein